MSNVAGVILAGGLSSRMKGLEKSLLNLAGKPLITHVQERLSEQVSPVMLNANGAPERFDFTQLPIRKDTIDDFAGPLAGVLAGMRWASELEGTGKIITAAADTPFFPKNYVKKMTEAARHDKIVLASSDKRRHPVFGLWDIDLADDLEAFLNSGDRKVMLFVQNYPNAIVDFPTEPFDPFFNVNTPDDWQRAEDLSQEHSIVD